MSTEVLHPNGGSSSRSVAANSLLPCLSTMLVVFSLTCWSSRAGAQVEEDWVVPHERGVELYRNGDYAAAAAEFETAMTAGAPAASLYNLARSYEQLGRITEAIEQYDQYLESPDIPPDRRARTERLREALAQRPGSVAVTSEPSGAVLLVDGEPAPGGARTPALLQLSPGDHELELRLADHEAVVRRIGVEPASEQLVEVSFERTAPLEEEQQDDAHDGEVPSVETSGPPAEHDESETVEVERNRRRVGPWIVLGLGLALSLTGALIDIVALADSNTSEPFDDMDEVSRWENRVEDLALAGDLLLFPGLAVALGGLIWLLVESGRSP